MSATKAAKKGDAMPGTSTNDRVPYRIDAIERGLRIMRLFTPAQHNLSLKEIACGADCVPSTALRLVKTLCDLGFLQEFPGHNLYRPGVASIRLGMAAMINSPLHRVALPTLRALHDETRETINLDALIGGQICHVERFKEKDILPTAVGIGSLFPAYCTAPGKLLMAFLPKPERTRMVKMQLLEPLTAQTITSRPALQMELKRIRAEDVAFADCEMAEDLRAVSAPVRDRSGAAVAAVTLVGSTERIPSKLLHGKLARQVKAAAAEITRRLCEPSHLN